MDIRVELLFGVCTGLGHVAAPVAEIIADATIDV
jgi:hypothetical protein